MINYDLVQGAGWWMAPEEESLQPGASSETAAAAGQAGQVGPAETLPGRQAGRCPAQECPEETVQSLQAQCEEHQHAGLRPARARDVGGSAPC